jgi:hypothetical protein
MDKSQLNTLYGTTENRINTFGQVEDPAALSRVFKTVRNVVSVCPSMSGDPDKIIKHMLDTYGIKLKYVHDPALPSGSGWDMSFEVADEKLYTFFLLQHN